MKRFIFCFFLMISCAWQGCHAQGLYTDPGRSVALLRCSVLEEKTIGAQLLSQALVAEGHYTYQSEVEQIVDFQKEFNEYLQSFREVIAYLAEAYGLYYEVNRTVKNMGELSKTIQKSPANTVAVALSGKRHKIYEKIFMNGLDVVNDVRMILKNGSKMTEQDRFEIIQGVRLKMKDQNKNLQMLNIAIKYTTLADVWRELLNRYDRYEKRTKRSIANECLNGWRTNFLDKSRFENSFR